MPKTLGRPASTTLREPETRIIEEIYFFNRCSGNGLVAGLCDGSLRCPGIRVGEGPGRFLRPPQSSAELQARVPELFADPREDLSPSLLPLGVPPPKAQESVQEVFL